VGFVPQNMFTAIGIPPLFWGGGGGQRLSCSGMEASEFLGSFVEKTYKEPKRKIETLIMSTERSEVQ